jgi:hypothetical protein
LIAPLLEKNWPRFACVGHRKARFGSILVTFGQYFPVPPLRSAKHGQNIIGKPLMPIPVIGSLA